MKINQYETTDNLQNLKFLGANGSQTVGVPFETVKEHVFKDTNATPEKDGLMSKEDKAKLDGLGEYSVTGVKGNAEANYRTGNVNITPANVGAVSKTGDTVAGHLHMGNDTMTNSPNIYWDDKNRSVWAGTMNGEGTFYIWDATNNKGIIISNPGGGDNRFLGTASGNLPLTGGKVNGTIQAGDKAWLFTDSEGGTLQILSHDGKYGYHMDGFLDDGVRLYVYQVDPWVYKGEMILDINGGLHASGGFKGIADSAMRLKDANGAAYNIGTQYSGELVAADWICAWQDLGNNDIRIRAVRQGNLSVANANTCAGLSPTSEASGSTIMSRDRNGDTSVRYLNCAYLHSSQGVENYNIAHVVYQTGDGYYRTCSLSHLFNSLGIGNYLPLDGGTMTGTLAVYQYGVTSSFHNAADALCIDARDIQYVKIFCREQVAIQHGPDQGWAWAGCSAGGFFTQSSERYKDNVSDMPDDMAKKILDVNIVTFDYKKNVRIESERYGHSGVLAEQIEPIIPEVVLYQEIDGEEVADSVDYSRFVPYLIKMVQVQQTEIDKLKTQIEKLEGNSIFTNKTITPERR